VHEELIPYNFHWRQKKERKREKNGIEFLLFELLTMSDGSSLIFVQLNKLNYREGKTLLLLQRFNKEGIIFYFLTSKVLQFQSNCFEGFHFAQATSQTEWKHLPCSLKGFFFSRFRVHRSSKTKFPAVQDFSFRFKFLSINFHLFLRKQILLSNEQPVYFQGKFSAFCCLNSRAMLCFVLLWFKLALIWTVAETTFELGYRDLVGKFLHREY